MVIYEINIKKYFSIVLFFSLQFNHCCKSRLNPNFGILTLVSPNDLGSLPCMPCQTITTRATTMDARVFSLETAFASILTLIAENVNFCVNPAVATAMDSQRSAQLGHHLPIYFEQFRCELTARCVGESSSALGNSNHPHFHDRDQIQLP